MGKTIKSDVRQIIFTVISKYKQKQEEKEALFKQKKECLDVVTKFIDNLEVSEEKRVILENLAKVKDLEQSDLLSHNKYLEEISSMTDLSVSTLKRINNEGKVNRGIFSTPGKKRPHQPTVSNLDSFDIQAIRNKINEFYMVKKQVPTLRCLLTELRESINFTGCLETLRRILIANGYEFKQNVNQRSVLIERFDIAAWRHRYLRTITSKRAEGRKIIYLDETYVHQNYKPKKSWQGPSTQGVVDHISPGKRFIIVHAGSEDGFVPNALLTFSTKSLKADYHHDMNATNFNKWLREKLIPNLTEPSVIIMDNASYHSVQINKVPNTNTRKAEIQEWLRSNQVNYKENYTIQKLLVLVQKYKMDPIYEADEILREHGHEVLRLPPYHCELNPIELIWSSAKRIVASKNIGVSAAEVEKIIKEAFDSITPVQWKTMTDHVLNIEAKYKTRDGITEKLESFVISVFDDESDSSSESMDVQFLESDFNYSS